MRQQFLRRMAWQIDSTHWEIKYINIFRLAQAQGKSRLLVEWQYNYTHIPQILNAVDELNIFTDEHRATLKLQIPFTRLLLLYCQ